jgi:hypothetical protein
MDKKSYQKGWIRPKGKRWYGHYEVKRLDPETGRQEWKTEAPIALGFRSQMSKFQAREALAAEIGGPGRDRTDDLFHAMEARSQLRHRPTGLMVMPRPPIFSPRARR